MKDRSLDAGSLVLDVAAIVGRGGGRRSLALEFRNPLLNIHREGLTRSCPFRPTVGPIDRVSE
jgi:hypothetical protein